MNPQDLERARNAWIYIATSGGQRFAVVPADVQEPVWDDPRPPASVPEQHGAETAQPVAHC